METIELNTKLHSNGEYDLNHEFIQPYYLETLQKKEYLEIQKYISNLSDSDYKFNKNTEFNHYDGYQDKTIEKYRSCKIHYPQEDTILPRLGRDYFHSLNNKFWKYDLADVFEFQLIKYDIGGNYNWHCDYGVAPVEGSVRKLSMSIHLTDPKEYEGGELNLINYSNYPVMVNNGLGSTIIFDSKVPHKVWPVTWGTRIALVGWANGPKLR